MPMSDGPVVGTPVQPDDEALVAEQMERTPRGMYAIGSRCVSGHPSVVVTEPRLPNGTPFPTTYYLTCNWLNSRIGTLENSGLMREMEDRLATDPELAANYRSAHEAYLADRAAIARAVGAEVPEIEGISAGGMPERVKCLHVLAAHSLARGPGVNLLGDEVLDTIAEMWPAGRCSPSRPTGG